MANLVRRNTGRGMDPWRDFFDMDLWGTSLPQTRSTLPAVNISQDDKNFIVEVVSPGFKREDFKIKVDDDILTISAESKMETKQGGNNKEYSRREYSYSSFTRSFRLPDNAKDDAISAKYNDGILEITIPKTSEPEKTSKEINIE
jgi:HSP20 family protein